ncbi:TIGR03643 family protein [Acinetobacter tandoii]|uniref:TIGR03643 family protein n=1 Tax=Acinetobacter tandoii TaxID=202954 RepID=A0A5N4W7M4_9GAMM|nr:TIGR03643 family protein [Acinetobacter tandoii]
MVNITNTFVEQELSRIIEMAWEDRTPFEAIQREYGLDESAVIRLMRQNLKTGSFKLWRKRMVGRKSKHQQLRSPDISRAYCSRQYKHA